MMKPVLGSLAALAMGAGMAFGQAASLGRPIPSSEHLPPRHDPCLQQTSTRDTNSPVIASSGFGGRGGYAGGGYPAAPYAGGGYATAPVPVAPGVAPPPPPGAIPVAPPPVSDPYYGTPVESGPGLGFFDAPYVYSTPRAWVSAEYLLWWVKNGPLPLGQGAIDYGTFSGLRLNAGGWFNATETIGMEASFLALEHRHPGQFGQAFLGVPGGVPVSAPGFNSSGTRLFGFEANGLFNLTRGDGAYVDLLAGFRNLNLQENLASSSSAFVGPDFVSGSVNYQTQNAFYGGQIGAKAGMRFGRVSTDVIGKVALGVTHQAAAFNALSTSTGPGGTVTQGGVARGTGNKFAVLPEVTFQVGYDFTQNFRAFVGYNFLYLSNVVRPGDQVSLTQPVTGSTTDYWAQGINFGAEFRW
jgi:hypothetical protein